MQRDDVSKCIGTDFQAQLAAAVGNLEAGVPQDFNANGLAVYRRLVHNNIASFLERCFSDSIAFADAEQWQDLQNRFLSEGKPESPYFKDIPTQFLAFARSQLSDRLLPQNVLAMMEFETDLLHAETALCGLRKPAESNNDILTLAEGVRLKQYPVDFIRTGLKSFENDETYVLTWRNLEDETCYQAIDDIDVFLLQHFEQQNDSIASLTQSIRELTGSSDAEPLLLERLAHWQEEGVLIKVQNG
ncbi:HvfC family RiPP maturation protein [Neisseria wadsworthii]|uniref:Uncharacterized protein n=1 Tax=Neisseria wadsworthii 9715 TaxID=1030841 RepID=G4CNY9_9NEIS|nr:putative DNA-binding domain-containing protein [Neisseria wadsworthii]EGZ48939.1 hypothetical protein HMPREF9370_0798 [Neisseria wadsworthii 9715]QMT34642.1 putative DNA-binding domain-containing protein [Neisseria wadsworthii]